MGGWEGEGGGGAGAARIAGAAYEMGYIIGNGSGDWLSRDYQVLEQVYVLLAIAHLNRYDFKLRFDLNYCPCNHRHPGILMQIRTSNNLPLIKERPVTLHSQILSEYYLIPSRRNQQKRYRHQIPPSIKRHFRQRHPCLRVLGRNGQA
jgi:hypothetical protein